MSRQRIVIPPGAMTVEEMELVAGKLFKCGYSVTRGSIKIKNKSMRVIEFFKEEKKDE